MVKAVRGVGLLLEARPRMGVVLEWVKVGVCLQLWKGGLNKWNLQGYRKTEGLLWDSQVCVPKPEFQISGGG